MSPKESKRRQPLRTGDAQRGSILFVFPVVDLRFLHFAGIAGIAVTGILKAHVKHHL